MKFIAVDWILIHLSARLKGPEISLELSVIIISPSLLLKLLEGLADNKPPHEPVVPKVEVG